MNDIKYDTYSYYDGEIQNIKPEQIAAVIDAIKPVVISVRCNGGDEVTIADISVCVRANGVHLLLCAPEAALIEP